MDKRTIEVSAQLLVSVTFQMGVDPEKSLLDTEKEARAAAERWAQSVTDTRGTTASAHVQRVTSFTTRLT